MSKIKEAWITTNATVIYYNTEDMEEFYRFLKFSPANITAIQITEIMTKEEFEKYKNDLG